KPRAAANIQSIAATQGTSRSGARVPARFAQRQTPCGECAAVKAIGIDFGGSCVKVAVHVGDAIVAQQCSDAYVLPRRAELDVIVQTLIGDGLVCDAVGIAVPGPVEAGALVQALSMPALVGVDIACWMRALLNVQCPVRVTTDTAAAAAWEHHVS